MEQIHELTPILVSTKKFIGDYLDANNGTPDGPRVGYFLQRTRIGVGWGRIGDNCDNTLNGKLQAIDMATGDELDDNETFLCGDLSAYSLSDREIQTSTFLEWYWEAGGDININPGYIAIPTIRFTVGQKSWPLRWLCIGRRRLRTTEKTESVYKALSVICPMDIITGGYRYPRTLMFAVNNNIPISGGGDAMVVYGQTDLIFQVLGMIQAQMAGARREPYTYTLAIAEYNTGKVKFMVNLGSTKPYALKFDVNTSTITWWACHSTPQVRVEYQADMRQIYQRPLCSINGLPTQHIRVIYTLL